MCRPDAPCFRANSIVAGDIVNCVYAIARHPATTIARFAVETGQVERRLVGD